MPNVAAVLPRFDASDPGVLDDPYPTYARLRAQGPLCRFIPRAWGVTRHADVTALLRRPGVTKFTPPERFYGAENGAAVDFFQHMDIARGDPRIRQALIHELSAAASRRIAPRVMAIVDRILEPLLDAGTVDVVTDLARPVVLATMAELIGVPADAHAEVRACTDVLVGFGGDRGTWDAETVNAANAAVERLREIVGGGLRERDRWPREDMLTRLAEVTDDAGIRRRAVDHVITLLYAGLDTTINLIGTGCAALARFPEQFARLRAAPAAAPTAVEEFLRYDAPIQVTLRTVREPVPFDGRVLREGRVLVLMLASANRDERVFRDPDRLDVLRRPNPHVSFGGGSFYCFGAAQARATAALVFERLARGCATLHPAGPPELAPHFTFRSYTRLPVTFTRST